ncbi:hypothetical protein [Corynebacterium lowii]|uniref:hypothetical protein n=1 Tax=Corynebacterium lowii TaxID=1544413 RepID=UPI0006DCC438|nr:hypothetical protein [Corynebacterium lowii]MDP9852206.1 X-X-X-Leu-X-X-Gly heptad repeat protein [Corynebacterium lowii]
MRSLLLISLALLPLLAGAVYLGVSAQGPESTWSSGEEPHAAPAAQSTQLADARRAAIDAGSNASFLANGTAQLLSGVEKFESGGVTEGAAQLTDGAVQLREGMIQLQAATGQMGQGATELADGVGGAIDRVLALGVIQGQLNEAATTLEKELEKSTDPRAADLCGQLADFKAQLGNAGLGEETTTQLTRLRDGSRDLANQLAVPGYGFHDGIYSATDGAKRLASGMEEMNGKVGGALDGMGNLSDGARQLNDMAQENRTQVQAIQRALPVVQANAEGEATTARELLPTYALLIAALALIGGTGVGLLRRWLDRAVAYVGVVAAGGMLLWLLSSGFDAAVLLGGIGIIALLAAASAGITVGLRTLGGSRGGIVMVAVYFLVQIGVVGWVWHSAMTADLPAAWNIGAGLLPLHYATGALSTLGNGGSAVFLWTAVAVLGAVTVLSAPLWRNTRVSQAD